MSGKEKRKNPEQNPYLWYNELPHKRWASYFPVFFSLLFHFRVIHRWYTSMALPNCRRVFMNPGFRIYYPERLFGDTVFLCNTRIMNYAPVYLGEGSSFGLDNKILTGAHGIYDRNWIWAKPVTIGKNVWVTTNCLILGGVTIGDNSIIGAGSVVSSDIPANCFAAGNPCKVVKKFRKEEFVRTLYPGEPKRPLEMRGRTN